MLKIDSDKTIRLTRGDYGKITLNIDTHGGGYAIDREVDCFLNVYKANDYSNLIFSVRGYQPEQETNTLFFEITPSDTLDNIDMINSPETFWYEIEVDPDEYWARTFVGYDTNGPKLFIVYPEIGEIEDED